MSVRFLQVIAALGLVTLLTACGSNRGLHDFSNDSAGPDEFSVLPVRPLQLPERLTLPVPTPGGVNLADPNPEGDAIAALGGRPSAQVAGGIPAGDSALVNTTRRYGVTAGIRQVLASEDADFRRARGRLNTFNWFGGDRYFQAYASQALNAQAEFQRFRNAGAQVPSAPPAN